MCVDYTDLKKHCPKDPFGLPRIDQVVDSTAGCSMLSFLDYYSGYHQVVDSTADCFYHPVWSFLLYLHVVRTQERRSNLPESHSNMLSRSLGQVGGSLCR
jgi:hypothetical protein